MGRLWGKYERQLSKRPYAVNMATSAVLWGVADCLAQRVGEGRVHIDAKRAVLTSGFGAMFMGPVGHLWYSNLDGWVKLFARPGSLPFLAGKIAVDSFIFGPLYVLAFYAYGCATIDGTGVQGFTDKVRKDFLPTFAAELAVWPLFQAVNFSSVPIAHQLLAVNMASLVDATFLSWARSQEDWVAVLLLALQRNKAQMAVASA